MEVVFHQFEWKPRTSITFPILIKSSHRWISIVYFGIFIYDFFRSVHCIAIDSDELSFIVFSPFQLRANGNVRVKKTWKEKYSREYWSDTIQQPMNYVLQTQNTPIGIACYGPLKHIHGCCTHAHTSTKLTRQKIYSSSNAWKGA